MYLGKSVCVYVCMYVRMPDHARGAAIKGTTPVLHTYPLACMFSPSYVRMYIHTVHTRYVYTYVPYGYPPPNWHPSIKQVGPYVTHTLVRHEIGCELLCMHVCR